jgi:hypothetical protein
MQFEFRVKVLENELLNSFVCVRMQFEFRVKVTVLENELLNRAQSLSARMGLEVRGAM